MPGAASRRRAWRSVADERPLGGLAAVVEDRLADELDLDACRSMHSTVRTSRCSASSSAGGRVCGVIVSSPRRGPIVSASRTTTQPPGVCQVVTSVFVPGS